MKYLIIGASGLVGSALLRATGDAVGTYRTRQRPGLRHLDAADSGALRRLLDDVRPDLVLFPAAEPNVEWCEAHPAEAERRNLDPLRAVLAATPKVIAFSSDYVFDGHGGPYAEDSARAPLSVYGRIKLFLEEETIASGGAVIRTTGVFGVEPEARNYVQRVVETLRRHEEILAPSDQLATPTYAEDLARATLRIAARDPTGLWHVAGPELVSRDELARRTARAFGLDAGLVRGAPTSALGQRAARPLRGGLICSRYEAQFGEPPGRALDKALVAVRDSLVARAT